MTDDSDEEDDLWDPAGLANSKPDASVTPKLFKHWRTPRFGRSNPERMNNPVWEWLVRCRVNAYGANEWFDGPSSFDAGPCWCFRRFGQSRTKLPDGRMVLIGGEHEDYYDPDFFIYNDVVVKRGDGDIEIYGYPEEVFPPTDSHTATLIDDEIIIIGCLGYRKQRKRGTPVYRLDLQSFRIRKVDCTGTSPGWIYKHTAVHLRTENAIVVTGGKLDIGDEDRPSVENIDDWKFHLADHRWERLTKREWKRWDLRREDGRLNTLFEMHSAANWKKWIDNNWRPRQGTVFNPQTELDKEMNEFKKRHGFEPDLDLFAELYDPPVQHEKIPAVEDEFHVYRININGVTVRYNQDNWTVSVTVEGDLPTAITNAITSDLRTKLAALERTAYEVIRL